MNKNYRRGRSKEYRIKKKYEKLGYTVLRTAGSHGFADLIALKINEIIFIQVKPKKFSEKKKRELLEKYDWLNDEKLTKFIIE